MKRPMRVRVQGGNIVVTIPREVIVRSRLTAGSHVYVDYDAESGRIWLTLAPSNYTTAAEQRQTTKVSKKYAYEIADFEKWLQDHPDADIEEYLEGRRKRFEDKLVAQGIVKKEESN